MDAELPKATNALDGALMFVPARIVDFEFINQLEEVISMFKPMFHKSILMGSALLLATAAEASGGSGSFNVTATVLQTCSVSASDLNFGNINVVQNVATPAQSTIALTCGNGVTYNVGLDQGLGAGGTVTNRSMTASGGAQLAYALYQEDVLLNNWGNTAGIDTVAGTGNGNTQSLTVWGNVPAGQQTVPAGTYNDTITVYVYY